MPGLLSCSRSSARCPSPRPAWADGPRTPTGSRPRPASPACAWPPPWRAGPTCTRWLPCPPKGGPTRWLARCPSRGGAGRRPRRWVGWRAILRHCWRWPSPRPSTSSTEVRGREATMADVEGPSEARPTAAAASAAEPAPSAGIHAITRRQFLSGGVAASVAGAAGLVVARHPWAAAHARRASIDGRGTLVMVTLYGGNDGLNTVIPFEDGHYLGGRAQLGYQPNEVLAIGDGLGLHPSLKGMKQLWGRGQLAIVRGVGYPNPSRSHFRSMDIWQSGVPDHDVPSGWLGRWLDTGTDPLRALSIGPNLPRLLAGERASGAAVPLGAFRLPGGPSLSASFAD